MVDAIIIVLVIILLFFALKGSLKHFKGESPCCGGGSGNSGKAKTKFLDGPVIGKKTLTIEGMHCEHCVNAVTNALNEIDGVVAKVTLKSNSAEVSYDREINEADLKNAVKKAGYEVTTPVIVTNSYEFSEIETVAFKQVERQNALLKVQRI